MRSAVVDLGVAKSEAYPAAIDLVNRGIVRLEPLVSHVMPFRELKAAIGMLATESGRRMKIILEHN